MSDNTKSDNTNSDNTNSDKGYTVSDRRGVRNEATVNTSEACRVCGCSTVHTREYEKPTMDCVRYLRSVISDHEKAPVVGMPRRFRWPTKDGKHPNGTQNEWCYGAYFPLTDLVITDMGKRGTGRPDASEEGAKVVQWVDQIDASP